MAAILLAMLFQADPYEEAAKGIELPRDLPSWKAKGARYGRAVELLEDRAVWAAALRRIGERTGLATTAPRIQVFVDESDEAYTARGGGRMGQGEIRFNLKRMVSHIENQERFEKMRRDGRDVRFRVPPTPLETVLCHELSHCFVGTEGERWFVEGVAAWVAGEEAHLWQFQNDRRPLAALDRPMEERDLYPRGMCAIQWLHDRYGAAKVRAVVRRVVEDRIPAPKAVAEAAGLEWRAVVTQELEWSREFLKKYTPPGNE